MSHHKGGLVAKSSDNAAEFCCDADLICRRVLHLAVFFSCRVWHVLGPQAFLNINFDKDAGCSRPERLLCIRKSSLPYTSSDSSDSSVESKRKAPQSATNGLGFWTSPTLSDIGIRVYVLLKRKNTSSFFVQIIYIYNIYIWCRVARPWDPPPRREGGRVIMLPPYTKQMHYPPPPCGTVVLPECRGK